MESKIREVLEDPFIQTELRDWLVFILKRLELQSPYILKTDDAFNIRHLELEHDSLFNIKKINNIRDLNAFFEVINNYLPIGGFYIGAVETSDLRKNRLLDKYPFLLNHIYYSFDYFFKRIFPKIPIGKQIAFFLAAGRNKALSYVEVMGRLYYAGFKHVDTKVIDGVLYYIVKKDRSQENLMEKTYGPLIKLPRKGFGGGIINVYKFRTMHSYAEYIQELIYDQNKLEKGGKFKDDYRVFRFGKFMRKYWLDELPMIINVLKGEMKLVGIRPLSIHYQSLYSEELQKRRLLYKPGLLPPFYADLPGTIEEIQLSEMKYLEQYDQSPKSTDIQYFGKILKNILVKKARSK
jgi:hypothetical protein